MSPTLSEPAHGLPADMAQRWENVLFQRHSVRTYTPSPLDRAAEEALSTLQPAKLNTARVRPVLVEGVEATAQILTGLVGSYGRITGAPGVLLFVAHVSDPGYMAAGGYLGQQLVLEATALGLATCWVSGAFSRAGVRRIVDLAEGEEVLAVSPVGLPKAAGQLRRFHDLSLKVIAGSTRRKPLSDLVQGNVAHPWLQEALEAARWAPSAANGQPWRFTVDRERVSISYEPSLVKFAPGSEDPRALDCGIAMANFAVAARTRGVEGDWVYRGGHREMAWFPMPAR